MVHMGRTMIEPEQQKQPLPVFTVPSQLCRTAEDGIGERKQSEEASREKSPTEHARKTNLDLERREGEGE